MKLLRFSNRNPMSNGIIFAPPQVHDVIYRKRLHALLESNSDKRVILIQGQAAQGKSTLIASYLNHNSLPSPSQTAPQKIDRTEGQTASHKSGHVTTVWLHLDQNESDHTNLFDLLINALLQRMANQDAGRIMQKATTSPATLGTGEDISRQVDIILSILASLSTPVAIVLDNLESLDNSCSSYPLIQSIINRICATTLNIQLFLISREFPPLNISRLKMEQSCLILKNEDLAFTYEETESFLRNHQNSTLPSEVTSKIHTITEGWPGGVALISESISRDVDISSFPLHLTVETLEYFSREVYALLPESIKQFLMRASLFDEIDEEMAAHLCDMENGHEILHYLEKRNLFIQRLTSTSSYLREGTFQLTGNLSCLPASVPPLASKDHLLTERPRAVCYRFNTLFKHFLFKALTKEISSDEIKTLSNRAARFFEKRGEIELAVRYYLDGEDYSMASDMVKKCATDLLVRGRFPTIENWIETLPEKLVQQDPWLIYYLTVTRRVRGGVRNVEDFLTALTIFKANGDIRGAMLATAHLIEAGVFVRKSPAKIAEWIRDGERLLFKVSDNPLFSWARALLWQHIAFGYIAGEVDIHKGISSCKNAKLLAKRIGNREIELNASIVMAFGYVRTGNFSGAEALLKELKSLTNEDIHPEYRALTRLVRIDFALKQGGFDAAERYLQESEKDVEKFGLIFLYPAFIELKAMHRIYTGRFREAMSLADHLSDFSILSGNTFYLALAHHIKAMVHYQTGCIGVEHKSIGEQAFSPALFELAKIESEKSMALLQEEKGEDGPLFTAKALNGLILIKLGIYREAERALTEAFDYFETVSSGIAWCETRAALGLLFWKEAQQHKKLQETLSARAHILAALNRAFQEGYERFSLMAPSDFFEIILLGICFDDSNLLFDALSPLIANRSLMISNRSIPDGSVIMITALLSHPLLATELKGLNRLRDLYRLKLPRVTITTLGQFSVCINGQPIAENIWDGNKPKLFLKSVICHNTKEVPKEVIIDDIWPDASLKAGEKNFKVNLHRLRKALEPDVNKQIGYSYITMDTGRVSLDPALVTVDIDTFTALMHQGYEKLSQEEMALAISFLEQAVNIYRGDFLAEEPYEAWIDLKRDALRTNYVELLMTLARVYEEQEQPFQSVEYLKKAIQADPLYEEAYQNLMIVYADAGMITAATTLYEKWLVIARSELGVEPDPETRNIYNKIQALQFKNSQVVQFKKR